VTVWRLQGPWSGGGGKFSQKPDIDTARLIQSARVGQVCVRKGREWRGMCVCEREREGGPGLNRCEKRAQGKRERRSVCVCVGECV